MNAEEHDIQIWRAGDVVPAGTYLRVDDHSYRVIILNEQGHLPASCDGHVALYCRASARCPHNVQADKSAALTRGR
jgi:hypothetical protein